LLEHLLELKNITMKSININKIKFLLFFVTLGFFVSCDEGGEQDPGATAAVAMAGDWYVKLLINNVDVYGIGYYQLSTYNTAANDGTQIWIDDHGLWPAKVKATINLSGLTFDGSALANEYKASATADISNGKIIKKGTTAPSGTVVDSIFFNVEYADDPGTVYEVTGYKRTGFLEDEH